MLMRIGAAVEYLTMKRGVWEVGDGVWGYFPWVWSLEDFQIPGVYSLPQDSRTDTRSRGSGSTGGQEGISPTGNGCRKCDDVTGSHSDKRRVFGDSMRGCESAEGLCIGGCVRVGEAKNPGPGAGNSQVRQSKLADYGIGVHVDARADGCRARGFEIERCRGDGNCLYTALGKSIGRGQSEVRADLVSYATKNWYGPEDIGAVYSIEDFVAETGEEGVWGGEAQIIVWAEATGRRVVVHSLGDTEKVYGDGFDTHLLYSNTTAGGETSLIILIILGRLGPTIGS